MAKDPAFLFYSKDWLEGTAELLPAEKGIYIDLLCHQHQKGDLPNSTERLSRIVGISHDEFLKIWGELSKKFVANGERIANKKLTEVMSERSTKGLRNTISGTFAAVLKKANLSKIQYDFVRSKFKIDDFEQKGTDKLTERLTEWLYKCLKSIEDANANEDVNEDIHTVFSARLLKSEIDKTAIEVATRFLFDKTHLEQFNANCVTAKKVHMHYSEYIKHFRNWIGKMSEQGKITPIKPQKEKTRADFY